MFDLLLQSALPEFEQCLAIYVFASLQQQFQAQSD
jgi:hypothetical protein